MNSLIQVKIIFIVSIVLLMSYKLIAQGIEPAETERIGQSGWQFLKINGDARVAAMGGAYVAASKGDASSTFGNPASLSDVKNIDISLSHVNWIADITYQTIAIAKNFENIGVFGINFAYLNYGDMLETINSPIAGEDRTSQVVTGNTFSANDFAIGISYSKQITDKLSIGGNVKYIKESIAEVSMSNWALDFGTVYYTGFRSLRVAMTARNFGPDVTMTGYTEEYQAEPMDVKMPIDFRLGVAMDFFDYEGSNNLLTLSLEFDHPNDGPEKINFGTEYSFQNIFFVRGGYKFNYDEEGLVLGAGLKYDISGFTGRFNYAYVDFGNLNKVHMIQLGISL
jgi:hypothetical protein